MKEITLQIPEGKTAEWINGVLTLVDEKPQDVTERIKTFEDACNELSLMAEEGDDIAADLLADYESNSNNILVKQTLAMMKLSIISYALNEGWEPQFTKGERRWYFWYDLLTREEYDELSAEDKSRVVYRGYDSAGANGGVSCAIAVGDASYSSASVGSRLVFGEKKLAEYAGRQFAEIYADFCFRPKSEEKLLKGATRKCVCAMC